MKLRGRLGALEEREFRLLWLSRVVSDFGDRFGTIGLAFAVLGIKQSASALAYVLAARTISSVSLFLVAGVWADRLPRQLVMLASDVGRGLAHGDARGPAAHRPCRALAARRARSRLRRRGGVLRAGFTRASSRRRSAGEAPAGQRAHVPLPERRPRIAGPAAAGIVIALSNAGLGDRRRRGDVRGQRGLPAADAHRLHEAREADDLPADLREGWSEFTRGPGSGSAFATSRSSSSPRSRRSSSSARTSRRPTSEAPPSYATITAFAGVGSVVGSLAALRFQPERQLVAAFLSLVVWTPVLIGFALAAPVAVISPRARGRGGR